MTTRFRSIFKAASIIGVALFVMVASASAGTITYSTNAPGTEFVAGVNSLILNSISGQPGTLTFVPNVGSTSGIPSNVDFGDFLMVCSGCTTSQTSICN